MLVVVTFISILLRKYYRNKYRKPNSSDDETTHIYDEIESDVSRVVSKVDSPIITENIAVTGITEDIIYDPSDANANSNQRSYTNCPVHVSEEVSVHATHCKSEAGAITVYQNDTSTDKNVNEDSDVDLHLYEPIGQVQLSKEASLQVTYYKSLTGNITVYQNETVNEFHEDPDLDLHLYEPIGQVQVTKEASLHVTYYKSATGAITVYQNEISNDVLGDPDSDLHLYESIEPEDYLD